MTARYREEPQPPKRVIVYDELRGRLEHDPTRGWTMRVWKSTCNEWFPLDNIFNQFGGRKVRITIEEIGMNEWEVE